MKYFGFNLIHIKILPAVNLLCLFLLLPVLAFAQSGGDYDVSWNTIDGGGGESTGGKYSMVSTFGQPDAGTMSGGDYVFEGGFLLGEAIPFVAVFDVNERTRIGRTSFRYKCWVTIDNLSPLEIENVQLILVGVPDNMTIGDPCCISYDYIDAWESASSEASNDRCIIDVDRAEPIEEARIVWSITYDVVSTGQTMQQTSSSMVLLEPTTLAADITGEGVVDSEDLAILVAQWLQTPGTPSADIAPQPDGDNIVNFKDFAALAEHWPNPPNP